MKSTAVIRLLRERHARDLVCTEIGTGHNTGRRFDLWAMRLRHDNQCCTGYEVKVSKKDWRGDEKYHTYLPGCHRLYVVSPWGLVDPSEVIPEAGVLWVAKDESKLVTKKKAPHRMQGLALESMYYHVLCAMARGGDPVLRRLHSTLEHAHWLENEKKASAVGYAVRGKIERLFWLREEELRKREQAVLDAGAIADALLAIGLDIRDENSKRCEWRGPRRDDEVLRLARKAVSPSLENIQQAKEALESLRSTIGRTLEDLECKDALLEKVLETKEKQKEDPDVVQT